MNEMNECMQMLFCISILRLRGDLHRFISRQKEQRVDDISRNHVKQEQTNIMHKSRFLQTTTWIPDDSVHGYLFR